MYRLTVAHDDMCESPMEYDTVFKMHSFSTRHINFTDPDVLLACQYEYPEGHEYEGFACDEMPTAHGEGRIEDHEWEGPEGFLLSYFEHGLCRWGLAGTMSGMPDFRWDGVAIAGFLEVIAEGDTLTWWNGLEDERKEELAASMMEIYTEWVNGENYGYKLEKVTKHECDQGFYHEDVEDLDSCWGFTGANWFEQEVQSVLHHFDVPEDELEIVDKAFGAADYMTFYAKEAV